MPNIVTNSQSIWFSTRTRAFPHRGSTVKFSGQRTGYNNPHYKEQIRDGENATTALQAFQETLNEYSLSRAAGHYQTSNLFDSDNLGLGSSKISSHPSLMNDLVAEAKAKSLGAAWGKLREKQTPLQAQVISGELRETIRFLKSPLNQSKKLVDSYLKVRSSVVGKNVTKQQKTKRVEKLRSELSGSWLELQMGIIPLISDIKDILALANKINDRKNVLTYRFYGESETSSVTSTTTNPVYGFLLDAEQRMNYKAQCIVRYGIVSKLLNDLEGSIDAINASLTDLSSVPSTIWELTRSSFLIDYFANVGDLITAGTTSQRMLGWQSQTIIRTTESHRYTSGMRSTIATSKLYSFTPGTYKQTLRNVDRTGGSMAIPPLTLHMPGSNIKYMNIAALFLK